MKFIFAKIFNRIKKYLFRLYSFFYIPLFFNKDKILNIEKEKFSHLNLDYKNSKIALNKILENINYKEDRDSIHWQLAAAFSIDSNRQINNILEIGTYDGGFTKILSNLFNNAKITTIDLRDDDPVMKSLYNRSNEKIYKEYLDRQKKNTSSSNIISIKKNTFFLLDELKTEEKFDLIWVDGGHLYPDIAWDLSNAFYLLKKGGVLMCDDTLLHKNYYNNGHVSTDSKEVLEYIFKRAKVTVSHFLKRQDPFLFSLNHTRKYVTVIIK